MRLCAFGILALALCSACGGGLDESDLSACDPVAPTTPDLPLSTILGAGTGAAGTVYVVDQDGSTVRAFVSDDGALIRQHVTATATDDSSGTSFNVVSLANLEPPLTLEISNDADGNRRMGVYSGRLTTKTFTIGDQGEELTLLSDKHAKALPVVDYPTQMVLQYSASISDGEWLIVLAPLDPLDYAESHVFFGTPDHLDERTVFDVTRDASGSTYIVFDVDGDEADASFPINYSGDTPTPGQPSLTIPTSNVTATLKNPGISPPGASYFCAE